MKKLKSGKPFDELCKSIPKIKAPIYDPIDLDKLAKLNKPFHIFDIDYRKPKNNKSAWVRLIIGIEEDVDTASSIIFKGDRATKRTRLYVLEGYHTKICEYIGNICEVYSSDKNENGIKSILPITNIRLEKSGNYWIFKDSASKIEYAEDDPIFSKYFE